VAAQLATALVTASAAVLAAETAGGRAGQPGHGGYGDRVHAAHPELEEALTAAAAPQRALETS
jgi:hypothetical protein